MKKLRKRSVLIARRKIRLRVKHRFARGAIISFLTNFLIAEDANISF